MKLSPFKAIFVGILLGVVCIAVLGASGKLNTYTGQFIGDGSLLTNVPVSGGSGALLTNGVFQWQLDATFENTLKREGAHGVIFEYDRIDGSSATALWRTTDSALHFPVPPVFDGFNNVIFSGGPSGGLTAVANGTGYLHDNGAGTFLWQLIPLSDLQQGTATNGQLITWNGTAWVPASPVGILGVVGSPTIAITTNGNGSSVTPSLANPLSISEVDIGDLFLSNFFGNFSITGAIASPNFIGNGGGLSNIQGSSIVGSITGMIYIANGTAAAIDAATPGLGLLELAYDGNRMTVGDGSTAGGFPYGVRYWPNITSALTAGSRIGELAMSLTNSAPSLAPTLWMANNTGTNWTGLFVVQPSNIGQTASLNNFPFFSLASGNNGSGSDGATFGTAGSLIGSPFTVNVGSGGSSSGGGHGGIGGSFSGNQFNAGAGGNGTITGGSGGTGGNGPRLRGTGGAGGNDGGNAFSGGGGGAAYQINASGGNGGTATSSANGGFGGNAILITGTGGNAVNALNGGNAGAVTTSASGTNSGGSLITSAVANKRAGGNITTFGSSYAPMTIFTTSSTAGPNATTSATSLLGTIANLAPPTGQNSGAVIASNVVDHAGRTMCFKLSGYLATNGTPTLRLLLSLGGTAVIDTGTQTLPVAVTSTQMWTFCGEVTFQTTGSSGTCIGQGGFYYFPTATTMAGFSAANTTTTTIDTTTDESITCTAQFSTGVGCTMQCTTAVFELVN